MKKLLLIGFLSLFGFGAVNSQGIDFGATGGLFYGFADAEIYGYNINDISDLVEYDLGDLEVLDGGGFYAGFLADIELIDKFHVQPELLYANVGGESMIIIPAMAKYYVADAFNLQAGLQLDFLLDPPTIEVFNVELAQLIKDAGVSFNLGAGFDVSDKVSIQAKYSIGLTDRINDDDISDLFDALGIGGFGSEILDLLGGNNTSLKANILHVGVVYKFN